MRAQADAAIAGATKPITKLPTKITRQCGKCGETTSVMVEPGEATPAFKCKRCD
jgi:ribosomal protein S14